MPSSKYADSARIRLMRCCMILSDSAHLSCVRSRNTQTNVGFRTCPIVRTTTSAGNSHPSARRATISPLKKGLDPYGRLGATSNPCIDLPTAACEVHPKSTSAAGFHSRIRPWPSTIAMASRDASKSARDLASIQEYCCARSLSKSRAEPPTGGPPAMLSLSIWRSRINAFNNPRLLNAVSARTRAS